MVLAIRLADIPVGVLVVLGVLALVEVALDVVALVHLYRTPAGQVVGGNKWIWVALIVLVNLVGAVLYLAIGHRQAPAAEGPSEQPAERLGDIVDALYGPSGKAPSP